MQNLSVTQEEILAIASELNKAAAHLWHQNENGVFRINIGAGGDIDLQSFANDIEFKATDLLEDFMSATDEIGIKSFQKFAKGTSASGILSCEGLTGEQYVVRFGYYGLEKRTQCPLILQAHKEWNDGQFKIELLPMVPLLYLTDYADGYGLDISLRQTDEYEFGQSKPLFKVLKSAISDTCFTSAGHLIVKDIAILPNGTPVNVDPGAMKGRAKSEQDLIESLGKVFEFISSHPSPLRWFEEDGSWSQDKFFPNPFGNVSRVCPDPL